MTEVMIVSTKTLVVLIFATVTGKATHPRAEHLHESFKEHLRFDSLDIFVLLVSVLLLDAVHYFGLVDLS